MYHILHAPITWFESTPSGRIISRFSGDLSMIDRQLAFIFDDCLPSCVSSKTCESFSEHLKKSYYSRFTSDLNNKEVTMFQLLKEAHVC